MIKWEHSIFCAPFCAVRFHAGGEGAAGWTTVCYGSSLQWSRPGQPPMALQSARRRFHRRCLIRALGPAPLPAGTLDALLRGDFCNRFLAAYSFLLHRSSTRLALMLSPVALAVVLLYSYTKRFTRWSHLVLGLALGIAPHGGLDRGTRFFRSPASCCSPRPLLFWVAGFDVL